MAENYTKDLKESVYHGAVVSILAVGYTMLGKTSVKMSPPSLGKSDISIWCKVSSNRSNVRFYKRLSNQAKNNS